MLLIVLLVCCFVFGSMCGFFMQNVHKKCTVYNVTALFLNLLRMLLNFLTIFQRKNVCLGFKEMYLKLIQIASSDIFGIAYT
jgi:hypothetical protein